LTDSLFLKIPSVAISDPYKFLQPTAFMTATKQRLKVAHVSPFLCAVSAVAFDLLRQKISMNPFFFAFLSILSYQLSN